MQPICFQAGPSLANASANCWRITTFATPASGSLPLQRCPLWQTPKALSTTGLQCSKHLFLHVLQEGALVIVTSFCEEGDMHALIRRKAAKREYFDENRIMDMFLQVSLSRR